MKLKIDGVNCSAGHDYVRDKPTVKFNAWFNDGIVVIYDYYKDSLNYNTLLSVGPESSYIKTGKFPTKKSLEKRQTMVEEWVSKNKNRYKLLRESN